MAEQWHTPDVDELADAFLACRTRDEAARFLRDVCSLHELTTLTHRLQCARLLDAGTPYARVAAEVGASTTTVTRVAHWLKHGEGGYRIVLDRLGEGVMTRPFRLALPSKGRMYEPAARLARECGIEIDTTGRTLHTHCAQWDIEVLFARSDDIPVWAQDGAVEAAIAGRNQLIEARSEARELLPLGFGRCTLTLAVATASGAETAADLHGMRVATAYPVATADYFARAGVEVQIVPIHGSVELAPRLDAAEAIVDLVSTGETMRSNGLRPLARLMESEAVLLVRPDLSPDQERVADDLRVVMESVIAGRDKRYLMLNAPDGSLDTVIDLLPGLDSPTVLPLAKPGMHAVHAVVDRRQVVELLGPLRSAGASSILVLPIENLVP